MYSSGLKVPDFLVLTTAAYKRFVDIKGLRGRIALEFTRKSIINTGDIITVDGYPGIIVIQKADAT
jgi:phosphoenolpyruvate synthase/pyruvate phosphate dikinase